MTLATHGVVAWLATNACLALFTVWIEPLRLAFKEMRRRDAIAAVASWLVLTLVFWFFLGR